MNQSIHTFSDSSGREPILRIWREINAREKQETASANEYPSQEFDEESSQNQTVN